MSEREGTNARRPALERHPFVHPTSFHDAQAVHAAHGFEVRAEHGHAAQEPVTALLAPGSCTALCPTARDEVLLRADYRGLSVAIAAQRLESMFDALTGVTRRARLRFDP